MENRTRPFIKIDYLFLFVFLMGVAVFSGINSTKALAFTSCDTAGTTAPCSEDPVVEGCTQCHSIQIQGGNRNGTDRYTNLSTGVQRHVLGPRLADWTSIVDQMIAKGSNAVSAKASAYYNTNYCLTCNGPIISSPTFSNLLSTSATVAWVSEPAATSCVNYGTSLGSLTGDTCNIADPNYDSTHANAVTTHSVNLTGLVALTKYYVVHKSTAGGNTGTYAAAQTFTTPPDGGGGGGAVGTIISLATGDYNNDTNLDILIGVSVKNQVTTYLGDGLSAFSAGQILSMGGTTTPVSITSGGVKGDFNGDGTYDLAVANNATKNVSIFLGTGTATAGATPNPAFQTTPVYSVTLTDGPTAVVPGDFNKDGKMDLAIATVGATGYVLIYSGDGAGHFTGPVTTIPVNISTAVSPTITSVTPNSMNCVGLPVDVTIVGSNLFDGSTSFALDDGTALSVLSTSPDSTTVVARIPSGAHSGTRQVIATLGAEVASFPITINPRTMSIYSVGSPVVSGSAGSIDIYASSGSPFILGAGITIGPLTGSPHLYGVTVAGTTATAGNPWVWVNSGLVRFYWDGTSLPAGTYDVTVANYDACGGVATKIGGFQVLSTPPLPAITTLSPTLGTYGVGAGSVITISGSNFVEGATITMGSISGTAVSLPSGVAGVLNPFVFVNSGSLKLFWDPFSLAPGTYSVTVTNPASSGGLSGTKTSAFTVQTPTPTISLISPASFPAGVADRVISIYGSNFVVGASASVGSLSGVTVNRGGLTADAAHPFVWMSNVRLDVFAPKSTFTMGSYSVTVTNPAIAGGLSVTLASSVTVTAAQPAITSVLAPSVVYGSNSRAITITGSNFVEGATITVGTLTGTTVASPSSATATTPFVYTSQNQISFYWPFTSLSVGSYNVVVTNPALVGGLSATQTNGFTVTAPQPTITSLNPSSVTYGVTPARPITINGTNFAPGVRITVGTLTGITVISATSATAGNPFVFIASTVLSFYWPSATALPAGTYNVTVTNSTAAGGLTTTLVGGFVVN